MTKIIKIKNKKKKLMRMKHAYFPLNGNFIDVPSQDNYSIFGFNEDLMIRDTIIFLVKNTKEDIY